MSTNSQIAFTPLGKTIVVAATTSAPTGIQAPVYEKFDPQNAGQYRFINAGTNCPRKPLLASMTVSSAPTRATQ